MRASAFARSLLYAAVSAFCFMLAGWGRGVNWWRRLMAPAVCFSVCFGLIMLSCILGVLFNSSGSDERIFYLTGAVLLVLLPLPVCRFLLDFSWKRSAVVTSLVFLLYILPAGLLILSAPAGNPSGGTETPAPAEPAEVPAEAPEPQPSAVPAPENARKCTFPLRNELPGGLNIDRDMKMSTHITSLLLAAEALFSCKAAPETPTLPYEADPVLRTPAQLRSDAFAINIFREIIRELPGNVIFSPASLESLLRLVRQGARGRTAAELDALPVAPPGGAPPPLTRRSLVHGAF